MRFLFLDLNKFFFKKKQHIFNKIQYVEYPPEMHVIKRISIHCSTFIVHV